ncbi:MAG: hypothetical protein M3N13_03920 [Candidatus Eremiobacteraeota bacterium]|nr:hypothetical protein [Candidatus Eremiobacteraeota bacterium]
MARHDDYAGSGLGAILVAHAFNLALDVAKRSGSFSLVVDAKNLDLSRWYVALGFTPFIDKPLMLFIVNETMKSYLDAVQQRLADED